MTRLQWSRDLPVHLLIFEHLNTTADIRMQIDLRFVAVLMTFGRIEHFAFTANGFFLGAFFPLEINKDQNHILRRYRHRVTLCGFRILWADNISICASG